jgi:hypothetical protein
LIALFFAVFFLPTEARAGAPYGVVTVDLQPERGAVPTDVCVVSQAEGPRSRTQVHGELLGKAISSAGRERAFPVASGFWPYEAADRSTCGEGGGCAPRVSLPPARAKDSLFAACTTDELLDVSDQTVPRRLLVIMLEHLEGSPPAVEALRLTGGIVTIGVRARLRDIVVTARSVGGHFLPSARSVRARDAGEDAKVIVLPLEARCDWVDLELPGGRLAGVEASSLGLTVHGEPVSDPAACSLVEPGRNRVRVLTPRSPTGGRVALRLPPGREGGPSHYASDWSGAWPVGVLRMRERQQSFIWRRPACVYPSNACPEASVEGGIACSVESTPDGCSYTCPGDDEAQADAELMVSAPTTVTFRDQRQGQRWSAILQRSGQILEGFVERDRVYLESDISKWELDVPGSRVTHLEVLGNDGSVRRYALEGMSTLRLRAPEAGCDPVRYRFVGDRHYHERSAEIRDGKVLFDPPEMSVRTLDFVLNILQGGGPAYPTREPVELASPIYFTVQPQIAASFRPRKPKLARYSFEARIGGTIGQWGHFDPSSYEEQLEGDPLIVRERILWGRFLFEPAVVVDVWGPFALGAGIGVGSSWPIDAGETTNTSRFRFILAPSVEGRVRLRRWLEIVGQVRGIFFEDIYLAVPEPSGQYGKDAIPAVSLLGLYGVAFRF